MKDGIQKLEICTLFFDTAKKKKTERKKKKREGIHIYRQKFFSGIFVIFVFVA